MQYHLLYFILHIFLLLALLNMTTLLMPIMHPQPLSTSICHKILLRDMQPFLHFALHVAVVVGSGAGG